MPIISRTSLGVGLVALGLATGLGANAQASTQFSAQPVEVASTVGHSGPQFRSFSGFLGVAAGAVSELLSGPIAAAGVALAFEAADYYAGDKPEAQVRVSDADYAKAAAASFDSAIAPAS